jgi:hypothetical protein
VEAIDCSSSRLVFEGLQNMRNLHYLKYLGNKSLKIAILRCIFVIAKFDGKFWPHPNACLLFRGMDAGSSSGIVTDPH